MREHRVSTPDGRTLAVSDYGPADGSPILVHNGMPNSRLLPDNDVARSAAAGVRLLCYDRPGYGQSDRHPGRSVASCTDDVRAIAAALEIERLPVWGISGGGPHALACAALLEDLVPAVGVLASPAPWGADGLDFFTGMGELNVEDTQLYFADRAAARAKTEADRLEMLEIDAAGLHAFMRTLLAPVDAEIFDRELADYLVVSTRDGLAPGSDGWWDDGSALLEPWGFDFDAIRVPVLLRHGGQDRFVPFGHGQWLARRIPGVEAILTEEDGHLTLLHRHLEHLNEWLLARV